MEQKYLTAQNNYEDVKLFFQEKQVKSIFIVCGNSFSKLPVGDFFRHLSADQGIEVTYFSDFTPNPKYESVVEGVKKFIHSNCDLIVAAGGGSAMDVAKCIKLYSNMDHSQNYLSQKIIANNVPLFAIPTTAGTGSEATRFAVIYFNGEKQSVANESSIPSTVLFDASTMETLPLFQKKVTMLDAFCHSIESFWSVNATNESQDIATQAIQLILSNYKAYLSGQSSANESMLLAANLAGKAINITQTTAGHAMCYKITSLYGIPHGQAAAMCVSALWPYTNEFSASVTDPRGESYLKATMAKLGKAMGCESSEEGSMKFSQLLKDLQLDKPVAQKKDFDILKKSVNPVRLKNHPIFLTEETIESLYHQILD